MKMQLHWYVPSEDCSWNHIHTFSLSQSDGVKPDLPSESGGSKVKPSWKETSLYSLHRGDGKPPLTKVFTKTGDGRHPLLSNPDPAGKEAWPTGKLRYLNYIHPAGHSESRMDFGPSPQRPIPDKVLFRTGSTGPTPKEPLGIGNGKILLGVHVLLRSSLWW